MTKNEKHKQRMRIWYQKNKDVISSRRKEQRKNDPKYTKEYYKKKSKEYREKNREKLNSYYRQYYWKHHGNKKTINLHGYAGTKTRKIYSTYKNMIRRCTISQDKAYKHYGGRGIKVCDEWLNNITNFVNWSFQNGFQENLSLDRINNNGDYSPTNCRWVGNRIQSRNKRSSVIYKKENAIDGSIRLGGSRGLIASRLLSGWSVKKAFTTKVHKKNYEKYTQRS